MKTNDPRRSPDRPGLAVSTVGVRPDSRPAKCFGYARCSTDEQSTGLQTDALTRAGATSLYSDDGVSGGVPAAERPGFGALLAALSPGDTVVFYSLSRLGRSTVDVLATLAALDARGVIVRSVTEPFDTASPMGRAMAGMLAVFAQLERDLIRERTRAGMAAAVARGSRPGRPRKAGHELVREMLAAGATVEETVEATGLSASTVRRVAKGG